MITRRSKVVTVYVKGADDRMRLVTGHVDLDLHRQVAELHKRAFDVARQGDHATYTALMGELKDLQHKQQCYILAHPVETGQVHNN